MIKSLRTGEDIIISKPCKGSSVVILNHSDYISEMNTILTDTTKFKCLEAAFEYDNTAKIESKLQRRLLSLTKDDRLPRSIYESIYPTRSLRPGMYGSPKIHNENTPLRSMHSVIGSSLYQLAKFLSCALQPVLDSNSSNCIKDPFTFVKTTHHLNLGTFTTFLCSFHISSLFTNVPLHKTIQICAGSLYEDDLTPPFS